MLLTCLVNANKVNVGNQFIAAALLCNRRLLKLTFDSDA